MPWREAALSPLLARLLPAAFDWERTQHDSRSFRALCSAIGELSELFTRRRAERPANYLRDPRVRRAYLAYFLPVNLLKVQSILDELPEASFHGDGPFRVCDVGAGPGTALLGLLDWMHSRQIRRPIAVDALDRSGALSEATALWDRYITAAGDMDPNAAGRMEAFLHCLEADLEQPRSIEALREGSYDLVIAANVLNELYGDTRDPLKRRIEWVHGLLSKVAHHGSLVIIEPALRETARHLHGVRNQLLALGVANVYSPCLHQKGCPALVKTEDWCHEERPWSPPPWISAIDREVGFIKDALKFAYVVFRKDGERIVASDGATYRLISELRVLKGDRRAWACHETGLIELGRLDRARSDANAGVDHWHRGAIVRVGEIEWRAGQNGRRLGRIGPATAVTPLTPRR